jgi:fungal type III polyketide synthase
LIAGGRVADRCYLRLDKVLTINEYTGIESRSSIGNIDHPRVNAPEPPSIAELCDLFLDYGVKLSVAACRKAIAQWGGDLSEITHIVSTTCTNSANPGYDHYVVKQLGLNTSIEKVLLHGVGCSGGLAALRTAANIALGLSFRRKPARILVLACEISTTFVRSELESIHKDQDVRIGVTLFSDCASAVVLGNGFSDRFDEEPLLEMLGWDHKIIDDTEKDLGFDVDPLGEFESPSITTF